MKVPLSYFEVIIHVGDERAKEYVHDGHTYIEAVPNCFVKIELTTNPSLQQHDLDCEVFVDGLMLDGMLLEKGDSESDSVIFKGQETQPGLLKLIGFMKASKTGSSTPPDHGTIEVRVHYVRVDRESKSTTTSVSGYRDGVVDVACTQEQYIGFRAEEKCKLLSTATMLQFTKVAANVAVYKIRYRTKAELEALGIVVETKEDEPPAESRALPILPRLRSGRDR